MRGWKQKYLLSNDPNWSSLQNTKLWTVAFVNNKVTFDRRSKCETLFHGTSVKLLKHFWFRSEMSCAIFSRPFCVVIAEPSSILLSVKKNNFRVIATSLRLFLEWKQIEMKHNKSSTLKFNIFKCRSFEKHFKVENCYETRHPWRRLICSLQLPFGAQLLVINCTHHYNFVELQKQFPPEFISRMCSEENWMLEINFYLSLDEKLLSEDGRKKSNFCRVIGKGMWTFL